MRNIFYFTNFVVYHIKFIQLGQVFQPFKSLNSIERQVKWSEKIKDQTHLNVNNQLNMSIGNTIWQKY